MTTHDRMLKALNRLAKWRVLFAGWQLGTRTDTDAEANAVKDHRELSMISRAEITAITRILIEKGVCTFDELEDRIALEADELSAAIGKHFPGIEATDDGLHWFDIPKIRQWMRDRNWRP